MFYGKRAKIYCSQFADVTNVARGRRKGKEEGQITAHRFEVTSTLAESQTGNSSSNNNNEGIEGIRARGGKEEGRGEKKRKGVERGKEDSHESCMRHKQYKMAVPSPSLHAVCVSAQIPNYPPPPVESSLY